MTKVSLVDRVFQELKAKLEGYLILAHLVAKVMLDHPVRQEDPDLMVCCCLLSVLSFSISAYLLAA